MLVYTPVGHNALDSRYGQLGFTTGYTNARIKEFDRALREFCEQNKVGFVEIFEPFEKKEAEAELLPDSLHPNGEGHQLIADAVSPKLKELFSA